MRTPKLKEPRGISAYNEECGGSDAFGFLDLLKAVVSHSRQ
jgi:hypothetical protein